MKVLGIDPGYGRCGVAVVEKESGKETLLYSACIETSASDEFPVRLATIVVECERLLKLHTPEAIAIERLYFSNNQKTAMQVAEIRGALLSLAAQRGLPVAEYTPGQVKSAVAGHGGAEKKQVAAMLHLLISIEKKIQHDDEYDAIAIALTHLACARPEITNGLKRLNTLQ